MKVYKANVEVTAVFYDGSEKSLQEVKNFTMTARGVVRVCEMSKKKGGEGIFINVISQYANVWLPLLKDSYIVKYQSNLIYPYKKSVFEKRFKEVK